MVRSAADEQTSVECARELKDDISCAGYQELHLSVLGLF